MKVIISAAGTGGHINPGIAIANKIKEKEPKSEKIFIGTNRGLENDLVPRAGYKLKTIEAYGLKKEFSIDNIKHIFQTMKSRKDVEEIFDEIDYKAAYTIEDVNKTTLPKILVNNAEKSMNQVAYMRIGTIDTRMAGV